MIPLLVKEKVQFYYYLDKWKDNMEKINNEYTKRVLVYEEQHNNYTRLEWVIDIKKNRQFLVDVEAPWTLDGTRRFYIDDFRLSNEIRQYCHNYVTRTPLKYHYSSGLNHPEAFKQSIYQIAYPDFSFFRIEGYLT
jgi:hypothetical protein